jgi:hypothetical protein
MDLLGYIPNMVGEEYRVRKYLKKEDQIYKQTLEHIR